MAEVTFEVGLHSYPFHRQELEYDTRIPDLPWWYSQWPPISMPNIAKPSFSQVPCYQECDAKFRPQRNKSLNQVNGRKLTQRSRIHGRVPKCLQFHHLELELCTQ